MTEDEYLAYGLAHEGKYEFVNGELVAMSGCSLEHSLATMNVGALLHGRLRGAPCRVHSPDVRVHIGETGMYAHPDVTVVCGRAELAPTNPPSILNPRVVFEVLSPSTEAYDRGAKAAHYRQRPSIEAIVFVATEQRRVEVQTRNADGTWRLTEATTGEIAVPPLKLALPLDEVYAGFDALAEE